MLKRLANALKCCWGVRMNKHLKMQSFARSMKRKLIMRMDSLWENIVFATLCTIIAILFWITLFHLFQSWYLAHKQDQNSLDYSDTDTISVKSDKTLVNHAFNSLPV